MRMLFRIALIVSAMAVAGPAFAQATTKYDGAYAGVARENLNQNMHSQCTEGKNPYMLTITNGAAKMPWGTNGTLEGMVSPSGALTMHTTSGTFVVHVDGQIDATGKVTAGVGLGSCSYRMTWQKK